MIQHQLPHSIMDQIKDAGYQCWNQIYSPLFWILSVLVNHWKLQENNTIIIGDNFSHSNIVSTSKKSVNPPPPPPRIITSPPSLRQQPYQAHKQTPVTVEPVSKMQVDVAASVNAAAAAAAAAVTLTDSMLSPKLNYSLSTPPTTKRKQSTIFSSWKQKQLQHRPSLQYQHELQPKTSFLRRLSSSSTSSGDTTKSEPSSPSILKSFSLKLKRHQSDSSLETRHSNTDTTATNSSKQPRLSFSHFKKKKIT